MWLLANGFPHDDWYTANSEDHSGPGEWREVKGHYVVTLHGGVDGNGILTPDIIETALEMDRNNEDVFGNLLQGGMPDGSTIPVYSLRV